MRKFMNNIKKLLSNDSGYISIESVVVAGVMIVLGVSLIDNLREQASTASNSAITRLIDQINSTGD